jgi:farnesyl-diphosphate farnesyltransferase
MSAPPDASWAFCTSILTDVSRSFALIIPQLPAPLDRSVCVAYLLCRLADTVEDEPSLEGPVRQQLYDKFLSCVDHPDDARADDFIATWPQIPEGDYGRLVQGARMVLESYRALPSAHHGPIRDCVHEMIDGMRNVRPLVVRGGVAFICRDLQDLDRYCHYVAGVVGVMSTRLFELHIGPRPGFAPDDAWRERGRRMGLGLQMTNIIKDRTVDAERGVSFIPADYVDPAADDFRTTRAGLADLIEHTVGHLDEAMRYIAAIPPEQTGIRTFLLGSVLPAIATLEVAAGTDDPQPKITRDTMAEILNLLACSAGDDALTRTWYDASRERTLAHLGNA